MKLPKYVFLKSEELDQSVILKTTPAYFLGRVYTFRTEDDYFSFLSSYTGLGYGRVDDYFILIVFGGTLSGRVQAYPGLDTGIKKEMQDMADWYAKEKVQKSKSYFKKFKS